MLKKFYLICLAALLVSFCGCGRKSKQKLIMVTNATFPPYEYVQNGKIDGIDPAIIKEIADNLGYDLEILDINFESIIAAVQSGKADIAASGITVTEERKQQVLFTTPYVISEQLIIVNQNSSISSASDLKNCKIGVQHGTTGDLYVTDNIKEPERFSNGALAVAALRSGKIDAVVCDREPAEIFVKQRGNLKLLNEPLTYEEYAFAIGKHNHELYRKVNEELMKMKSSGKLDDIIKFYRDTHSKSFGEKLTFDNSFLGKIKESFYLNFVKDNRYKYLVRGFGITVYITFFALAMGLTIGLTVAIIRSCADQTGKLKIANAICKLYLTVIRGTPVVVQLLIIYFVIFGSVNIDKIIVAIIAFGINSGAYVAEIIRGGIMSIDKGQMEAGRSLGLSYSQTMREVITPQAIKNVLPALGNEFIVLLKETSVSGYIALQDLTKGGDIIRSQTYDAFLPLLAVALIYLGVVMFLSALLGRLEKRLKKNE